MANKKYRPALLKWHEEEQRNKNGHLEYFAGAITSFGTHFSIFIGDEGFRIEYSYAGNEEKVSVSEPMPVHIYEKAKEIAKRNCQKIYEQQWFDGSEVLVEEEPSREVEEEPSREDEDEMQP